VAAGGPAEGARREEDGRGVHAARRQGPARPHGALHLPGGEYQGADLHLRLRERYAAGVCVEIKWCVCVCVCV